MIKAKYTIVLKSLLDDEKCKQEILTKGLGTYPLYKSVSVDEDVISLMPTRDTINEKILNHYKYREIGFETVGRFIDELNITMNEIMPYYNQLLRSVDMMNSIDDIFGNVDVTETTSEISKGSASGNSSSTSKATDTTENKSTMSDDSKTVHADTPQSQIDIPAKNIDNVSYADNVQWNKNNSNSEQNSTGESETESQSESESASETERTLTYHKKGNQGVNTYAHDIIEFRQTILNVEQQIINDKRLKELFMLVF